MLEGSRLHLERAGDVYELLGALRLLHQLLVARTVPQRERQELKEPKKTDECRRLATGPQKARRRRTDPLLALRHRVDRYGLPLQLGTEHLLPAGGVET